MAVLPALSLAAGAQDIVSVLHDIERNNLELQAARSERLAAESDLRSSNSLEAPTVEYSPFLRRGTAGVASSELVVSQDFDFPTLYAARRKAGRFQTGVLDSEYQALRREILLAAHLQCLDLILLERTKALMRGRLAHADELLALYERKMANGDATALELNRIKMERMELQTAMCRNEARRQRIRQELQARNGNRPLVLDSLSYPASAAFAAEPGLRSEIADRDANVRTAEASVAASEQEVRVSRQGWLPKLAVGYRRNTDLNEAAHGFMVGVSLPLFSNASRIRAARSRKVAAQRNLEHVRVQAEREAEAQLDELRQTDEALRIYDLELLRQSLNLLKKAVAAGQLSLIDYYTEADKIYQKWETFLELENRSHKLRATLLRHRL